MESRLLKRNPQPAKQISRPVVDKETAKPQPVSDTGVGGSSLDTMTAACATEMMNAASSFHKLHLKITGPGSYAAHKALNDLYDALPDHADSLIEGYQGASEKLLKYTESVPRQLDDLQDAVNYLRDMYAIITKLQAKMPYSEIVNSLDTVKDSINAAKYKLLFLS
jgi:DNA-binding ferritin-like protein